MVGGDQEKNKYSRSAGAFILRFANEIEEPKETGQTGIFFWAGGSIKERHKTDLVIRTVW
jgi:hypothetical protein